MNIYVCDMPNCILISLTSYSGGNDRVSSGCLSKIIGPGGAYKHYLKLRKE